jgi:hypothetical protein
MIVMYLIKIYMVVTGLLVIVKEIPSVVIEKDKKIKINKLFHCFRKHNS